MRPLEHDMSTARVQSAAASAGVGAHAYAQGSEIHFGAGQYAPEAGGNQLLGHELTHVIQQGSGPRIGDINTAVGHYAR